MRVTIIIDVASDQIVDTLAMQRQLNSPTALPFTITNVATFYGKLKRITVG